MEKRSRSFVARAVYIIHTIPLTVRFTVPLNIIGFKVRNQ